MASQRVGLFLRDERLRRNLNLDDISRLTRIPPRFIEAIEDDDYSRLPAIVFARGFVRQYSAALNVDCGPLLAALPKPDLEGAPLPEPPPGPYREKPYREKGNPRVKSARQTVLFLAAAIGAGTFAWAHFGSDADNSYFSLDAWRVRHVSAGSRATAGVPAPPIPPALGRLTEGVMIPSAITARTETPKPGSSLPPSAQAVEVTVAAHEASWVQIMADGKTAFTGTLQPGDARTVAAEERVKVLAGNAGGVELSLNGKKLDPLGTAGQVRSITLTSDGPLAAVQNPPSSDVPY